MERGKPEILDSLLKGLLALGYARACRRRQIAGKLPLRVFIAMGQPPHKASALPAGVGFAWWLMGMGQPPQGFASNPEFIACTTSSVLSPQADFSGLVLKYTYNMLQKSLGDRLTVQ